MTMKPAHSLVVSLVFMLTALGCGDDDAGGCVADTQCGMGRACIEGMCVDLADSGTDAGTDATDAGSDTASAPDTAPRPDSDMDGLADEDEAIYGTDPDNPDSDGDGLSDGDEVERGSDPTERDSDGDGVPDGDEVNILGTDPATPDSACADTAAEATRVRIPVDIIIAIDSSGSMNGEIEAVERNLNVNLAAILEEEDVDHRVILVAEYRNRRGSDGVCVGMPLSGIASCESPPGAPVSGERFFHYDGNIGSHNAYQRLLDTYGESDRHGLAPTGWREWLREGAKRAFVIISDDDPERIDHMEFDEQLLALSEDHFGTAEEREYVWHSIIGMRANDPPTEPWRPEDPIASDERGDRCGEESRSPAPDYQRLSVLTGGLRFPLCNNDAFDAIFRHIARDVVLGVSLRCAFSPERPPGGETPDFSRTVVVYDPSTGEPRSLRRVADESECADGDYYVEGLEVRLCPATCDVVQADDMGSLAVHVACEQLCGNGAIDGFEECDDGNMESGDGCSETCTNELF